MKLETFFENFESLTDAPNAVAKLREIVLQLAVRGKLVPQDSNDEPASILVEKIQLKKAQLLKDGKIGKSQSTDSVNLDDVPYKIPASWKWLKLGSLVESMNNGLYKPAKFYSESGVACVRMFNIQDGQLDLRKIKRVIVDEDELETYKLQVGDFIVNRVNSRELVGKAALVQEIKEPLIYEAMNIRVRLLHNQSLPSYINLLFRTNIVRAMFLGDAKQASGQASISQPQVASVPVPLPPLAEQKRIVEKCDRLLILCDEIEKRQQQRQSSLRKMNEGAISQLLTAQNPDDFQHHWQRICNNFDLLYSIPETIPKLRQAILQLAVQGKLVLQSSTDEPASKLLKQIKAEREALAQTGQLKLQQFSSIEPDDFPYQLPTNWIWVPLGELLIWGPRNGYSPKPVPEPTEIKSLTLTATTSGRFKGEYFKYVNKETEIASHLWLENGDILMQRANTIEYVGVAAIYRGSSHQYIYPDLMMKLRCSTFLSVDYIHLAINSEKSRNFLRARATGTSSNMPKINQATVNNLPIPLPPLAEQTRIVAKVDSLLSLCDALEAKLKAARDSSATLMEVAARQVLVA